MITRRRNEPRRRASDPVSPSFRWPRKERPVVVVQADHYNQTLRSLVVAEVTHNLLMAHDPACLFIDHATPEGQATGVVQNSVVCCLLMATIKAELVHQVIGVLSDSLKLKLNDCLKAALALP